MSKGQQKQVLFRYNIDEHPDLDLWLDNQSNRTQSIVHALEKIIRRTGVEQDIVKETLRTSLKDIDSDSMDYLEDNTLISQSDNEGDDE